MSESNGLQLTFRAKVGEGAEVFVQSGNLAEFQGALSALGLATPGMAEGSTDKPAPKSKPAAKPAPAASAPTAPAAAAPEPKEESSAPTPAEAAAAIRGYGSKHGIEKAKALLTSLGFTKTGDITADKAAGVIAAVAEADL